jgi:hypothetical protein
MTLHAADAKDDAAGAKDLFFGADNPAIVEATGIRPVAAAATDSPVKPSPAKPSPAKPATRPGLRVWLSEASDASGTRKLSPQTAFRTGDRFKLWLQSNRDGYIYLVNVGTSGTTHLMYPRPGQDNHVTRFKDLSMASPLVFTEPAGTEQLVVVLSATPIDDAPVQLKNGGMQTVKLKPGSSKPAPAANPNGRDPASESLDLALADLRGSKDLKFEDDGSELVAVTQKAESSSGDFAPVVVNLRLTHR